MSAAAAGGDATPPVESPKFPLVALGDVNAAACEGDACLVPGADASAS